MYIVGCRGLLKVSGTTPFVYQLLMTLLVMVLQLVSMWSAAVGEVKELPQKWTNITIHTAKIAICCVHG